MSRYFINPLANDIEDATGKLYKPAWHERLNSLQKEYLSLEESDARVKEAVDRARLDILESLSESAVDEFLIMEGLNPKEVVNKVDAAIENVMKKAQEARGSK